MWSEQYEKLSSYEKGEFRRLGNYLLSHTYMVRFTYDPSEETTLPVYSVPIRPLARENKASGTESKAIFTEAKATSIINMAHIIV
ncbi:MAG: hypothetical protein IIY61_00040 [Ruminococcus sp.]|nr:hypothetical protein [Ruminococcus sp.]